MDTNDIDKNSTYDKCDETSAEKFDKRPSVLKNLSENILLEHFIETVIW